MSNNVIKKELNLSPEQLSFERNNVSRGNNFTCLDKGFIGRKGVSTDTDKILFDFSSGYTGYGAVIPTDTYIYVNSKRAKVVIVKEWEDMEDRHKILWFKLVFADGSFREIGSIDLSGNSPGTSADIDSFTLYSGKGVRGSGLFFIIKKSYYRTGECKAEVYELSSDISRWTLLSDDDMYSPTVFFNGRGESYYIAYNNDPTYKLDAPRYLESKNLLTGAFKSYFTTDGQSFAFSLPFDNLTDEEITCAYKYNRETEYKWTIKAGHTFSDGVSVAGKEIALHCDREKGRMVFRTKEGELYPLVKSNDTNNIWFKAYKTNPDDKMKVASMNIATPFSGKSDDCAMTVFAGSELYPSTVLWIDSNNPLYFPEICHTEIGDIKEKITRLIVEGQSFLAFKETEAFKGNYISAEAYQIEGILAGVKGSGSIKESKVAFTLESTLPDTPVPRTIKGRGGTVFFATASGGVYALKGSKISEISPIGTFNEPQFAVFDEGDYILFTKDKSFLLWDTKSLKTPFWYEQKYPMKVIETANVSSSPILFCTTGNEYSPLIYAAQLMGEKDSFFTFDNYMATLNEQSIETHLELELIKLGFSYNRLIRLKLAGESYFETSLLLKNENGPLFARSFSNMLKGKELLVGGVFSELGLSLRFKGAFRLGGIGCFYRSLKK